MKKIEKTVFISYRRTNVGWALAIYQYLTANGYDVFFDYLSIGSGDFEQTILGNIAARAHFIIILTPSALERCNEPGDWLRREIEYAIDQKRNIVPLMLEGFDFNSSGIKKYLTEPDRLAVLQRYQALSVPTDYFPEAMERLRGDRFLNKPLDSVIHPLTRAASEAAVAAQREADAAPAVTPQELTAEEWFERGVKAEDLDEQIRFYTEALCLNPHFSEVYYNRGMARRRKGDFDGAIADFNKVIWFQPRNANAYNNRGLVRSDIGDLSGAISDYTKAIRLCRRDSSVYLDRGIAHEKNGDWDRAMADYNEAIRLNPRDANAYLIRGVARALKGDSDGEIADYDEAIRLNPQLSEAYYNRGSVRADKGSLDGAIADYTEAIRLNPQYAFAYNNRGVARAEKGDLDGAIADYYEALRIIPHYEYARANLKTALQLKAERDKNR